MIEQEPEKYVLIFSHTDLDGVGVEILCKMYADLLGYTWDSHRCNYGDINKQVTKTLSKYEPGEIHTILIGDISVDEDTAAVIDRLYHQGVKVFLRDHHETAEWLNQYEWAQVAETDIDGIPRCGTYWMAETLHLYEHMKVFVDLVDSWDTWKWKPEHNTAAKDLNSLLTVMGAKEFTNYITEWEADGADTQIFTPEAKAMVSAFDKMVSRTAWVCEKSMYTGQLSVKGSEPMLAGVVFANQYISLIADNILDKHPELDLLMLVGLPGNVSFRSHRESLPVPLNVIAKEFTGSGGGHPYAAGGNISQQQFIKLMGYMVPMFSRKDVEIENWTCVG